MQRSYGLVLMQPRSASLVSMGSSYPMGQVIGGCRGLIGTSQRWLASCPPWYLPWASAFSVSFGCDLEAATWPQIKEPAVSDLLRISGSQVRITVSSGSRASEAGCEVTHVHLNDQTVAGFRHLEKPIFAVQFHPEASPGPHESSHLFREFVGLMDQSKAGSV